MGHETAILEQLAGDSQHYSLQPSDRLVRELTSETFRVSGGRVPLTLIKQQNTTPRVLTLHSLAWCWRIMDPAPKSHPRSSGIRQARPVLYRVFQGDGIAWMHEQKPCSIEAIVTDPPYGVREYAPAEQKKLRHGRGGVWRIPPTLEGRTRSPLPRFTVLTPRDHERLNDLFERFASEAFRLLVPGGHLFIATQPLLSQYVYAPLLRAGFEKRGEIVRLVQTLRGGDRPKNAEQEFADVSVMPRSAWEPWGLFRKPCEGRVQDNLRKWRTGGLRRHSEAIPFADVIRSAPTHVSERRLAPHPSLKPQAFLRRLTLAALPLGEGTILDPFMGSGSTLAAATAVGHASIGVEIDPQYFSLATRAIPKLAALATDSQKSPFPDRG